MTGGGGDSTSAGATAMAMADGDEASAVYLRAELQRARQELKVVQDEYDDYTQSSHELEVELEQELARAEKRGAQLAARNQQIERDLQLARGRLEDALAQLQASDGALGALRAELAACVAAKRQLEQEQDDLQTQVRILQATEADLKHKLEREMEDKVFLLSDQEELQRAHELATERFRTEIMDLKSELFVLQQKVDKTGGKSGQWAGGSDSAPTSMRSDDGDDTEDIDVDEDEDEDDERYQVRGSTVLERDELGREEMIASLQMEIDALSARVQDETEARAQLESEITELQATLAQAEVMETEIMEMTDELIEKSQEIRTRDMDIQRLQEEATALKTDLAALQEENSELSTRYDELQHQFQEKMDDIARLSDEVAAAQSKCDDLMETEAVLESQLEQEASRANELEATVAKLTKKLADSKRELAELEGKIQVDKREISQNRKQVEELHDINSELRSQLEEATKKAAELERASIVSSTNSEVEKQFDPKRLLLEIESLRMTIASLTAENTRLRNHDGLPLQHRSSLTLNHNKRVSSDLLKENYSAEQLARKYLAERTRNAQLLSRLQTVCGNIQVFCRVRPIIREELEKAMGSKLSVNVINHSDLAAMDIRAERVFGDADSTNDSDAEVDMVEGGSAQWKVFTFDRILGPEETQNDVFREVEPIAQSVVDGFKACVFAYGQTGSGKTYTMEGTPSDPGLNYRVVNHIFQSITLKGAVYNAADREYDADGDAAMDGDDIESDLPTESSSSSKTPDALFRVQVGVLEVYNDTLRDLVDTTNFKALEIRHDSSTGDICVPELTMTTVSSPEQTIEVLRKAQANRVTGRTDVHMHSSRSHSIVIVEISKRRYLTRTDEDAPEEDEVEAFGKLYLVDLAGSERVKKSNVSGEMLREAAHINKSLSALADVMEALDKKAAHVPYRNSKLTYLLQDVLNSSSKTVMIVNVGPTFECASETYRSLQLAERVRNIVVGRNAIVKNKKDILSAKKAFAEIQSLKQQAQIAARKLKQAQQTAVAMVSSWLLCPHIG